MKEIFLKMQAMTVKLWEKPWWLKEIFRMLKMKLLNDAVEESVHHLERKRYYLLCAHNALAVLVGHNDAGQ